MDPQQLPRMHTLKSVWVEDIAAAEREAAGERAALNGVKFLQVRRIRATGSGELDIGSIYYISISFIECVTIIL